MNATTRDVPLFPDLIGFRPIPADRRVDWTRFLDAPSHPRAQRAKKIDGCLVGALIALPVALTGETAVAELHSLAVRDLESHRRWVNRRQIEGSPLPVLREHLVSGLRFRVAHEPALGVVPLRPIVDRSRMNAGPCRAR